MDHTSGIPDQGIKTQSHACTQLSVYAIKVSQIRKLSVFLERESDSHPGQKWG